MTDLGPGFSVPYETLVQSLEDRVRNGVEQPDHFHFVFQSAVTAYELPREASEVSRVSGLAHTVATVFAPDVDYRFANNRLLWPDPRRRPDDGSVVDVDYTWRDQPAGLTDFNPGSVVGTLLRAVAREVTLLYGQVDQAYRRAFIDIATGAALDNVVALLGVNRQQATKARGQVTYSRRTAGTQPVVVTLGNRVADTAGRTYVTLVDAAIAAGATSVTVDVEAVQPGPDGNVNAGTVTVMPTPPPGVSGVTNALPIAGGRPAEPDDQLRERAKHALERAGNATLNALKFAVLGVDGVDGVDVLDHARDSSIPLGEVRLRYSASGDRDKAADAVAAVVDATRAAGVRAVPELITTVLVAGTFYLVPGVGAVPAALGDFHDRVVAAIRALGIGESLSVRRLNALAYQVDGLADVAEATLTVAGTPVADPYVVDGAKLIRPDEAGLKAVLLHGFTVAGVTRNGGGNDVALQLVDAGGTPVSFAVYALDLAVELRANLLRTPDQPPERVGQFTRRIMFTAADTATLTITAGDAPLFRPTDHQPDVAAVITAAAYPALAGGTATVALGG